MNSPTNLLNSNDSTFPQVPIIKLVSSIGVGTFMATLDASIVFIITNRIKEFYGVTPNTVQWIVLAYLLVMMAFTVIAGDLGDKYGNKLVFQIGMVIFAIGSLFCYLSLKFFINSILWLILSRIIQAFGATGMISNGMALVTKFTTTKNRGTAVGFNNLLISISVILGPILGAVVSQYWEVGGVFLINVPIGIIGFIMVHLNLPKTQPLDKGRKADYVGSILLATFLSTLILSASLFVDIELPSAKVWAGVCLGISILLVPVFLVWEKKVSNPLIDFRLIKNKKISIGLFTAITKHQGYIVIIYQVNLFLLSLAVVENEIQAGLIIAGLPVGMAIFAAISGKLSNTVDARFLCTIAMSIVAICLGILAIFVSASAPVWLYVVISTIIGICIGLFQSPNANSIMSATPKEKLGVTSGLLGLTTSIAINLGIALSTAILTFVTSILSTRNGLSPFSPDNYGVGLQWVFGVFALITAIGAVLSYFRGPEDRKETTGVIIQGHI
ncbi:MAG: MFS transporter [Candidatus Heimdallarchaeota archaeon]|nr:MFS transporter [Candidatus Heimdallarchaeota archaeon]